MTVTLVNLSSVSRASIRDLDQISAFLGKRVCSHPTKLTCVNTFHTVTFASFDFPESARYLHTIEEGGKQFAFGVCACALGHILQSWIPKF